MIKALALVLMGLVVWLDPLGVRYSPALMNRQADRLRMVIACAVVLALVWIFEAGREFISKRKR